jgi:hypothetical protein
MAAWCKTDTIGSYRRYGFAHPRPESGGHASRAHENRIIKMSLATSHYLLFLTRWRQPWGTRSARSRTGSIHTANVSGTAERRNRSMPSHCLTASASSSRKVRRPGARTEGTAWAARHKHRLPCTPVASASSVRNSERSPGSPPSAIFLTATPAARPAKRFSDTGGDAPRPARSASTTARSSQNSSYSDAKSAPSGVPRCVSLSCSTN